ncbi:hypothetical protein AC579_8422 [Pseudocercospora musae]|uniref:Uncharacterized protein n=1 Tax=Pseudocercospora musae TaxID=113226 RepID=A0A139II94_9PEZI|nr:hypothetical protein AC579_8422 [Pseudocercospora musae]
MPFVVAGNSSGSNTVYTPSDTSDASDRSSNMLFVYFSNEFPKDDLQDIYRGLHKHSKDRNFPLLARFLNEATSAVKDEVSRLPTELKRLIPPFQTLLSWVENKELREGLLCGAIDGVLLIVAQVASYIGYVESHPEELRNMAEASLAGLGIGLLASTAISLSSEQADLPLAGADAVRVAFRMGVHVFGVSENLEARDLSEKPETWACVVHNVDPVVAQKELDAMQPAGEVPETGKVFISAISRTSVTVSAPPQKLKALLNKCEFFRKARYIELPVYGGLCHAPHIYSAQDTEAIVRGASLNAAQKGLMPAVSVYSTSTGRPYPAKTATELYECVVSELLMQAICWDKVIAGIVDSAKCTATTEATLHCFGNSIPLNDLDKAFKNDMPELKVSTNNLVPWIFQNEPRATAPRGTAQSKLAIIGMSCRLPGGATNTEKFWEVLEKGLDVSRQIPADRFDIETHYDPTGKALNKSMTQYMCPIDEPGLFDAPFFNMSPREAQVVDPQMRLALVTAYEALERAGYVGNRTASTKLERIGTYYGQAADDYREVNQGQEVNTYYIPGGCRAFGPGRINYFFKFAGPSYSIDTACSSGLAAIEIACQALWNGDVDTAVTGGMNILTNPDADGYCRADGIGSLVIKRLEDAEADNDNILGVILGAGTNHSAEAVSITHPHAGHQAYLSRQVLRQAGVDPLDVSYVELHGTGTQAGDFEEMSGIMDVYAPLTKRRTKDQPLHIGAVKSNVGHGESVAGTTALIKVLMMLQKNAIPKHVGIKTEINPKFPKDFNKRNLHIPFEQTAWPQVPGKKRLAAINNFGAAGGNTTMVLEEGPVREKQQADPRQSHVVAVSAKTKVSLTGNIERLIAYLEANPATDLADLAYTSTARRYQHTHRVAITASDVAELTKKLTSSLNKVDSTKPVGKSGPPQVAFSFTGQGASHKSMNLELYRDVPTFREHIHHLDTIAQNQGFPSFIPALDGSFPQDHEHIPVITQLALVCTEMALAKYWASLGVKPDVVIGHSLGEYAAMHVAGVITASDAIFMVGRRAQMLQEKCQIRSHTMMAVRASVAQIAESSAGKRHAIACVNGPSDTVLSGTKTQMDEIQVPLEAAGYRCIKLDVAFAFHSEQTDPILDDLEAVLKNGVVFQEPKMPYVSPLLGKTIFDGKTLNANYVRRATREAVNFLAAMQNAIDIEAVSEETVWVEIGPHPVCAGFIKSIVPSTQLAIPSIRRNEDNWKTVSGSMAALHLAGVALSWNEFHRPFESSLRLLDLPTYAFTEKNHWLQYNGDWCLTKGNTFYTAEKEAARAAEAQPSVGSDLQTSTVQQVIALEVEGNAGIVVMQSDLMQGDLLAAAHGHRMNDCGVVTSSIHADIAYTLGDYLCRKINPKGKVPAMNMTDLVVTKGLVAQSKTKYPQEFRVTAATPDITSGQIMMSWQNVDDNEPFATATLILGDTDEWLRSWEPISHLINGRIESLERMATEGKASRFTRNMAYTLFASNLVDYADKYRGMQSVVMNGLEAFADVQLTTKESGNWTVAPYFIDSVAHLAGFVMNCSDAMDAAKNYCVTPGWKSMRFAKPLTAGAKYRSYVRMIPTKDDPTVYLGDVYIMQNDEIMGMVGGIQFRSYPRILLNRFFSAPDKAIAEAKGANAVAPQVPLPKLTATKAAEVKESKPLPTTLPATQPAPVKEVKQAAAAPAPAPAAEATADSDSITSKALALIANEGGLEISDLEDDVGFADLGVDSLLSLVISEKFRSELGVQVSGSLFLDYPTIGDMRKWLEEYYA